MTTQPEYAPEQYCSQRTWNEAIEAAAKIADNHAAALQVAPGNVAELRAGALLCAVMAMEIRNLKKRGCMTTKTEKLKPAEWIERVLYAWGSVLVRPPISDNATGSGVVTPYMVEVGGMHRLAIALETPVDWSENK